MGIEGLGKLSPLRRSSEVEAPEPKKSGVRDVHERGVVHKASRVEARSEAETRKFIAQVARQSWDYYAEQVGTATNHLPPDNVRMVPGAHPLAGAAVAVDARTSPTNIGLYMLSTVTAETMGLIDSTETFARLRNTIDTIKKLPKYSGTVVGADGREHEVEQLYNWYSIAGEPKEIGSGFISTVDNGNFAAFLIAILGALGDRAPSLTADLEAMLSKMRFDALYDRDAGLLYHGAYAKDGKLNFTAGHYDMIITEARCGLAAAIMLGQVPKSAWTNMKRKLGKEIDGLNVNKALDFQSYTGTMFEYLTPRLLMKHAGTPLGAADEQAVRMQIKEPAGGIWGRSEANSNTSKGYAAWGAKSLSQSKEFTSSGNDVIAPYAAQMATGIAPSEVVDNLMRMEQHGLRGRYGYCESATVKKRDGKYDYEVLPEFYAHHIGMGFLGMANYLAGDVVTDWFHGSPLNAGGVLEELLASPVASYAKPATKRTNRPAMTNAYAYEPPITYDKTQIIGSDQFIAHATPVGASTWANKDYALSHNETFYFRDNDSGALLGAGGGAGLDIRVDVSIGSGAHTKISKITIENKGDTDRDISVTGYLDWIMDDVNAYLNHPVYRNLYVETKLDRDTGAVVARRRTTQGPEQDRQPFGFFAIAGKKKDALPDWADGSRTSVLGRMGSLAAPEAIVENDAASSSHEFGVTLDPAAALSKRVRVAKGTKTEVSFVFGFTDREDQIPALTGRTRSVAPSRKKGTPHFPPDPTFAKMQELAKRTERDLRIKSTPVVGLGSASGSAGHFVDGGRTFVVDDPFAVKKPWSMVASNGDYGFVATAGGWAYSFGDNSQQDRITPYIPDNTSELPLRGVIVRDRATGKEFSIAPNPAPASDGKYHVEMSPGSIKYIFESAEGLKLSMTMFVASEDPAEFWKIDLENGSGRAVDLDVESFLKLADGASAFHDVIGAPSTKNARYATASDPFEGRSARVALASGEKKQISFVLGKGDGARVLEKFKTPAAVEAELVAGTKRIERSLDGLQVKTPDAAVDTMLNTWLVYQAYYAHYLGRSGYYQSGGAFGFRDQLQTVMNLLDSGNPQFRSVARKHILESSRHQFEQGSVQHWWHPKNNFGQMSTISDNLLWLPYAISHYLEVTGDLDILGEQTEFSKPSRLLHEGELDFCESMGFTESKASLYEHAKRAIDFSLGRISKTHGLPLIGKGDWNDGLDRVGHLGKGESVWLAFFLYDVLSKFAEIAARTGDTDTAARYRASAAALRENIRGQAWDEARGYFVRAFADSGETIDFNDAIVQAWAVLSGGADASQASRAVASAVKSLYKPESKTILLFDRVLDKEPWGGSLAAYPNGLRENNAQYTHGSSWLPRAVAELGDGDLALELYKALLPTAHADDPRYGAEPYVVAADIYGGKKAGEGGWTWYSGGPGWIYRTGIESILGLRFRGDRLFIDPCIPKTWPNYQVTHQQGASTYTLDVQNPDGVSKGVRALRIDGLEVNAAGGVPLIDDGKAHRIDVVLGS